MPRNAEVIRQWKMLKAIEASRLGLTIAAMAKELSVTTRTIRRDLDAVQQVGFPVRDDERDGKKYWRLEGAPFRALERSGLTLSEASALYFSRSLLEALAGTPFRDDLAQAFAKIEGALTPAMLHFLDQLPSVVAVKPGPRGRTSAHAKREIVKRLLEASVQHRRVRVVYHSASKRRTKEYMLEPQQVVFGQDALYLLANVPEYQQVRTFAIHRIEHISPTEETFVPVTDVTREVFSDSLGVFQGKPVVRVALEFSPDIAAYISERVWHKSQELESQTDGRLILTMRVSHDWALQTWVLGFGSLVRVLAPPALAEYVLAELEGARRHYLPTIDLGTSLPPLDAQNQRLLPFERVRGATWTETRPSSRTPTGSVPRRKQRQAPGRSPQI